MMTFIVPDFTMIEHVACFILMVGKHRFTLTNSKIGRLDIKIYLAVIRIKSNSGGPSSKIKEDSVPAVCSKGSPASSRHYSADHCDVNSAAPGEVVPSS